MSETIIPDPSTTARYVVSPSWSCPGGTLAAALSPTSVARILAQSILASERQNLDLSKRSKSGDSGRYRWKVAIAPTGRALARAAPKGWELYRITVDVAWAPRGTLRLETIKLGQ